MVGPASFILLGVAFMHGELASALPLNGAAAPPLTQKGVRATPRYDYIVVGGGLTGCMVAAELAKTSPNASILLLEAGPPGLSAFGGHDQPKEWASVPGYQHSELSRFDMPGEYTNLAWHKELAEYTVPESAQFSWVGRLLGGSGSINAMISMLPPSFSLASWPKGWRASDLQSAFTRLANELSLVATPSADGVLYANASQQLIDAAWREAGFHQTGLNADPEARKHTFSRPSFAARGGQRQNSATLYLAAVRDRVALRTGATVTRLLVSKGDVLGVKYQMTFPGDTGSSEHRATTDVVWLAAQGRLVLCAGALATPRLLMLSGIGPPAALQELARAGLLVKEPECPQCDAIDTPAGWTSNAAVGAKLTDHAMLHVRFRKPGMQMFRPWLRAQNTDELSAYFTDRTGPYTQYGPTSFAYLQSPSAVAKDFDYDLEAFSFPWASLGADTSGPADAFDVFLTLLTPASNTSLQVLPDATLPSGSRVQPASFPALYFGTAADRTAALYAAQTTVAAMVKAHPDVEVLLPTCGGAACAPGQMPRDDDFAALVDSYKDSHMIGNHFASTCALGSCASTENAAVVGMRNLHVADASLMPSQPGAHPVLTLLAIALKVSSLVGSAAAVEEEEKKAAAAVDMAWINV